MRFWRRTLLLVLLLAACVPTAPAPSSQPTSAPPPPQTPQAASNSSAPLVEASLANLSKTLHPFPDSASYTQSWVDAASLIWSGSLLDFDWNTLDYKPGMATDLPKVSADGKTYTFTLRNDLKWSDGTPVTVDDFVFAYDNASKPDNRYVELDTLQEIASYRAPDQSTLEVVLKQAKPRDLALGIVTTIGPVPRHVWDGRSWTDTSTNPEILTPSVVLGPFKVQDFKIAEHGVFTPVSTYWLGTPKLPQVEILANQQPTVAYESLKSGRANWEHSIPPAQYQDAKANPGLSLKEWTAANASYRALEFNTARPFLSDKRVREALARAVSRADVLDVAEQGLGVSQSTFIPPTNSRWVNASVEPYDQDLDKARQLLQAAGYQLSNGQLMGKDGQQVSLQVLFPTSSGPRAKIATYLQQQYKQLGINVEVKGLDFNAYTDQVQNRHDFDISLATYGGGSLDPDLSAKAQLLSTGQQNVTGYNNPQVDELFQQAGNELDETKRKQMYDQIQMLVNADLPSHYLYALNAIDAFSTKVQGVTTAKGDRLDYNNALLTWSVAQ